MFSTFAAIALSLTAAAPAGDWYYVDADAKGTNITFIDKDSIHANAAGNTEAAMFSVLAANDADGAAAFQFVVEFNCPERKSRLLTGEMFDAALKSDGAADMGADWEATDPGSQGDTILKFVCSKGATSTGQSLGDALPLAQGRQMLAERAAKASK